MSYKTINLGCQYCVTVRKDITSSASILYGCWFMFWLLHFCCCPGKAAEDVRNSGAPATQIEHLKEALNQTQPQPLGQLEWIIRWKNCTVSLPVSVALSNKQISLLKNHQHRNQSTIDLLHIHPLCSCLGSTTSNDFINLMIWYSPPMLRAWEGKKWEIVNYLWWYGGGNCHPIRICHMHKIFPWLQGKG